jgi:type I restriction enzyme S subunit
MSGERNSSKPQDILLPGWRWVKLGDVCELIMGQSPPGSTYTDKPEGLPFFQGKADFGEYSPKVRVWCTQPMKVAEEGDILISVRAPVGPVNMNNLKCCLGRGLAAIRCKDSAMHWFIFWYLRSKEIQITSLGSGSTFSAITRDDLENLEIPLPPLSEQKRISTKIQELMQEVERARTACGKQLAAANALRASYLREVFESEEAKKWVRKRLGEVCQINPSRPKNFHRSLDSLTSFVPMVAVDEKTGTISKPEVVPYSKVAKGYTYFEENDVLFAKITPCMQNGKHVIARSLIDEIGFGTTEFHVLRPSNEVLSEWVWYFIRQPYFLEEAAVYFTGAVGQQRVPDSFLSKYIIPLPLIEVQQRIAYELNEKMIQVENLQSSTRNQESALNALPQAILKKAFRGEL